MTLRILSIDGGGIRGVVPATILAELERRSGRRIVDLFDFFAGTSTGGILSLALTCPRGGAGPRPAAEIGDLYVRRGASIFPLGGVPTIGPPPKGNRWLGVRSPLPANASFGDRMRNVLGYDNIAKTFAPLGGGRQRGNARYPEGPLEAELFDQLGKTRMSEAIKPIVIMSCDLDLKAPMKFLGGGLAQGPLGDARMRDVARATSAGPTFFPALHYKDTKGTIRQCVDGGLVANDPSFVAFSEASGLLRSQGRAIDDVLLVSLGTGERAPGQAENDDIPQLVDQRTWAALLPDLLGSVSGGSGEVQRQQLSTMLGPKYVRLQPILGYGAVHAMDNVRPENIAALQRTATDYISTNNGAIEELVSALISA